MTRAKAAANSRAPATPAPRRKGLWCERNGCVIVRVRVTPKSSKDAVDGIDTASEGPTLRVRVRALPSEGEANAAVEKLLAHWLGMPKGSVTVVQGGKSRSKALAIMGDASLTVARLSEKLAGEVF